MGEEWRWMDGIGGYEDLCLCSTGLNAVAQCSYRTSKGQSVFRGNYLYCTAVLHTPDLSKGSGFGSMQPF